MFGLLQSTEGRKNAYRAIVQSRPPHLNNVYLATQVCVLLASEIFTTCDIVVIMAYCSTFMIPEA